MLFTDKLVPLSIYLMCSSDLERTIVNKKVKVFANNRDIFSSFIYIIFIIHNFLSRWFILCGYNATMLEIYFYSVQKFSFSFGYLFIYFFGARQNFCEALWMESLVNKVNLIWYFQNLWFVSFRNDREFLWYFKNKICIKHQCS